MADFDQGRTWQKTHAKQERSLFQSTCSLLEMRFVFSLPRFCSVLDQCIYAFFYAISVIFIFPSAPKSYEIMMSWYFPVRLNVTYYACDNISFPRWKLTAKSYYTLWTYLTNLNRLCFHIVYVAPQIFEVQEIEYVTIALSNCNRNTKQHPV